MILDCDSDVQDNGIAFIFITGDGFHPIRDGVHIPEDLTQDVQFFCRQHGNSSARKCMIFVQVLNSSLKFLGIEMLGSQLMLLSSSPPSSVFLFAGTRSSPSRCGASPVISHIPFPRIFFGAVPPFLVPVYPYPNKERSA